MVSIPADTDELPADLNTNYCALPTDFTSEDHSRKHYGFANLCYGREDAVDEKELLKPSYAWV